MFNSNLKKLHFQAIQTRYISDLLKNCDIRKGARIDDLSGRFLKDVADILTMHIKPNLQFIHQVLSFSERL